MKSKITLLLALILTGANTTETSQVPFKYYPLTTVVTQVKGTEVTATDFNGNDWCFDTGTMEDWFVGDYCSMVMDDNGTTEIYDDIIVTVRYSGYLEGNFGDVIERR